VKKNNVYRRSRAYRFFLILILVAVYAANAQDSPRIPIASQTTSISTELAAAFYARPEFISDAARSIVGKEPILAGTPLAQNPLIVRGEYLARAGDCIGCHTRPYGLPFAGGLALQTPYGIIVSTNITPDKNSGIGNYTLNNFDQALRHGLNGAGSNLYPAMPYANYARLTDDDLAALFAYFMQAVLPAKQENAKTDLSWPFSMRWLMKGWNWLYLPTKPYTPDATETAEWNRGAYLLQGLGHCSACHTPRSLSGAEKASTEKHGNAFLSGALIDGWYASALRTSNDKKISSSEAVDKTPRPGLTNWSSTDIVDFLKTGRSQHTAAFGSMANVVSNSTQHITTEDLAAIANYLKSVGNNRRVADNVSAAPAIGSKLSATDSDPTTVALRSGNTSARGAMIYLNNCSACHRSDGQGAARTFPSLARSSSVSAKDTTSLIRIVLQGSAMPYTEKAPSELAMPGFDWRLNDDNVADVLSFVRASWSNQAASITSASVAKVRAEIKKSAKAAEEKMP
jgi:mono/diheme cytochrome c family protein